MSFFTKTFGLEINLTVDQELEKAVADPFFAQLNTSCNFSHSISELRKEVEDTAIMFEQDFIFQGKDKAVNLSEYFEETVINALDSTTLGLTVRLDHRSAIVKNDFCRFILLRGKNRGSICGLLVAPGQKEYCRRHAQFLAAKAK